MYLMSVFVMFLFCYHFHRVLVWAPEFSMRWCVCVFCVYVMVDNNVSVGNLAADFNKSMNFEMNSHPFFSLFARFSLCILYFFSWNVCVL